MGAYQQRLAAEQAALDALNAGRWVGASWVPSSGPLRHVAAADVQRCFRKPHAWIHLVGDSTVRYLYAAWLTLLNGTERAPGYPRHTLPDGDRCSFARAGRAEFRPCIERWRGIFADEDPARLLRQRADGDGWSLSYEAWHANASAPPGAAATSAAPFRALEERFEHPGRAAGRRGPPDLILFSAGVWEAFGGLRVVRGRRALRASAARRERRFEYVLGAAEQAAHYHAQLRDAYGSASVALAAELAARACRAADNQSGRGRGCAPRARWPRLLLLGNGACLGQQRAAWPRVSGGDWPSEQMEELIHQGNARLEAWARAAQAAAAAPREAAAPRAAPLYLDRAPTMESVPRLTSAPCFHHHPYGRLSDTHVQIVLNALGCAAGTATSSMVQSTFTS